MTKTKTNKDSFYQACIDACKKLNKKQQSGVYVYNILDENGLIDHILSGNLNLNDYTDTDLKSFRGIGNTSIDIVRVAWSLYTKQPMQCALDLDSAELRGYSTGKDLIRWIKEHGLENKQIYYSDHDYIGFILHTNKFEGMDYHTIGDINIKTGSYTENQEYIS